MVFRPGWRYFRPGRKRHHGREKGHQIDRANRNNPGAVAPGNFCKENNMTIEQILGLVGYVVEIWGYKNIIVASGILVLVLFVVDRFANRG